ncbi:hypothetical protein BDL97_16G091600 [Sphagnum fallax]|nr:hypothetical protein BDL97_16G091600 [Sphagnum fallax]
MDPLSVLRDYTVRGDLENVKLVGDEYHFGDDYRFPRGIETAYRSKQGGFYNLESLVFFVTNTHLRHTDYMQLVRSAKLQIVTFTDRKPLQDYLEGKVATNDAIELLPPAPAILSSRDEWGGGGAVKHSRGDQDALVQQRVDEAAYPASKKFRTHAADGQEDESNYPHEDKVVSAIDLIREREWPVRDRESILLCHNKNFEGMLLLLNRREDEKKAETEMRKEPGKSSEALMMPGSNNPASRYVNVEEKRFWKDHLGTDVAEELGIDPSQSYIADHKKKDALRLKPELKHHRPHQHPYHQPSVPNLKVKTEGGHPIIIVPNASQTLINTYNVKEFLEDGTYVAPDVKAKTLSKRPENVLIQRKMGRHRPVTYEVQDKPASMPSKDWDRVVAVFVLGKDWQFKDWPFKDHVEIFIKLMGVFLRFEDDSVESAKAAMQWNVKIISLSKHKRHKDKTAVLEFWDGLDASIRSRKLNLVY